MSLTAKQDRFVAEYVIDHNATKAAIRAGYSERTASVIGHENLRKPQIIERLDEIEAETARGLELTREFVISRLMTIADVGSGSTQVRALELLGKHLALFTDRLEVTQMPDSATVQEWIAALKADIDAARRG
jgi:phage terminase small subunit